MPAPKYPAVAYSITVRVTYPNRVGMLSKITAAIAEVGGDMGAIDLVESTRERATRDLTINARDVPHSQEIVKRVRKVPDVRIASVSDDTFRMHLGGKIQMSSRVSMDNRNDLSKAYTPGVARVCMAIHDDPSAVWTLTSKANTVAVVSDGTAVLGLGDIGPEAAMPVMEGKAMLFKKFGEVDAWPICLRTKDPDEIVRTVKYLSTGFGGINLEDISAPRCFYIEEKLQAEVDIPVFHDDQHGTAVVALAGIMNALKVVKKDLASSRFVLTGAGASAVAVTKLLMSAGAKDLILYDRKGALNRDRDYEGNQAKQWIAENTNPRNVSGLVSQGMEGADVFIGLSGPGVVTRADVQKMNSASIVFAMANPDPEIQPEEIEDIAAVIGTGRSDYPNQINNALCFPGFFRGLLDVRASRVNDTMKIAAAEAIASCVDSPNAEYVIPNIFDRAVARQVARAVADAAYKTGVARRPRRGKQQSLVANMHYTH